MNRKEIEDHFHKHLMPGEAFKWVGLARQGIFFRSTDLFIIPFSILWTGMALSSGATTYQSYLNGSVGLFRVLFILPFLAMGLYLVILRFFIDSFKRKHAYYAITDQRVLINNQTAFDEKLVAIELANLPALTVSKSRKNLTTIEFGPKIYSGGEGGYISPPTFEQIRDGESALRFLRPI
jgi:hypothetical protein